MAIIGTITPTISNGQTADAPVVTAMLSYIQSQVNANACPATSGTGILKGDGTGGTSLAVADTDYASVTSVTNAAPSGAIDMFGGASAPSGWLLCNGSAVSRTTYAALFTAIGIVWGAGDGSTTFNLPNFANSMPIGVGSIAPLGAYGGSANATLPSHTHTATTAITDSGHSHGGGNGNFILGGAPSASVGGLTAQALGSGYYYNTASVPNTASATTGVSAATTVNSTGSSPTNANLPPYAAVNFIIKT